MVLKHNYFYFKKAIPVETCKKIIKAGRKKITEKATVGIWQDKKSNYIQKLDQTYRNCKVAWIKDQWIYDIINPFLHRANKDAGWNFQWDWNETSQFTIYEKGHYYGWHTDQGVDVLKNPSPYINGKIRKLSLTLQLTDRTEYEGGDFQFKWIEDTSKVSLKITTVDDAKDMGTIIIFPSFLYHQVLPITKGKRESLVNWSVGEVFK